MKCEVWVLRIVCKATALDESTDLRWNLGMLEALGTGRYCRVGADICEPIECYEVAEGGDSEHAQRKAAERAVKEHARTGSVHKVVLTSDI